MDGHGSHFTLELLTYCRSIGLHVVLRPPHTTHILQGEDVVHFGVFKAKYHQNKMMLLAKKVFMGKRRLTVADLLLACRDPWEEAFSLGNCVKAWSEIGVSPFTQKVYWDLLEKKKKKEAIASKANINPENLTIEGMVKIMFNIDPAEVPEQPTVGGRSRKRDRDTLHSCDLWDLPGGATGEECMERVRRKTEARQQKEAAAASKKANTAQRRQAASSAANEQGSRVVSALVHTVQVSYLTRANLEAALQFKGIKWDKKELKPALVKLLQDALALPSDGPIPVLVIPDPPAPALAPAPVAVPAGDADGVEDESENLSEEDDDDLL
ncbi:hypothetical protein AB1Y20_015679 [Prymnesium parvum]